MNSVPKETERERARCQKRERRVYVEKPQIRELISKQNETKEAKIRVEDERECPCEEAWEKSMVVGNEWVSRNEKFAMRGVEFVCPNV